MPSTRCSYGGLVDNVVAAGGKKGGLVDNVVAAGGGKKGGCPVVPAHGGEVDVDVVPIGRFVVVCHTELESSAEPGSLGY